MKLSAKILGYLTLMFFIGFSIACNSSWLLATTIPPVTSYQQTLTSRLNSAQGSPIAKFVERTHYALHTAWPALIAPKISPAATTNNYWDGQQIPSETEETIFIETETSPQLQNVSMVITPEPTPTQSVHDTIKPSELFTITNSITNTDTMTNAGWPSQRTNILLIGADGRNGDTAGRSDTIIIVSIDPVSQTVAMLSLPRDLWLTIPGYGGQRRINSTYRLGEQAQPNGGGAALLKQTLEKNFGIKTDYYAQVNFEGFEKVVDVLGGVDVTVPELINTAAFYGFTPKYINREGHYSFVPANVVAADGKPVQNAWEIVTQTTYITSDAVLSTTGKGYKMLYLEPGQHTIDGATALQYARSRAFVSADFVRMQHQQAVLLSMRQKLLQTNMLVHLPDLWAVLQSSILTDLPLSEMIKLGTLAQHIQPENIHTLTMDYTLTKDFTTDKGARVLLPQYDKINPLTQMWFGATPITTTTTVTVTTAMTAPVAAVQ